MSSMPITALEVQLKQVAKTSKEEEARLKKEADETVERAKRLRTEANELVEHSKRLRQSASKANRLSESLGFEALCLSLSRNDAETTSLDTQHFPEGYAPALVEALRDNTQVSSLDIWISNSVFCLETAGVVCEQSIQTYIQSLADFVRTSTSLRHVMLNGPYRHVPLLHRIYMQACFQSQHIETLDIVLESVPPNAFEACSPSSAIQHLFLDFSGSFMYSRSQREEIGSGIQRLSSLTSIQIETEDNALLGSILAGLRLGVCQLDVLELVRTGDDGGTLPPLWTELTALLHSKDLKHLSFSYFRFNARKLQELTNALKRPDGSISVPKLSFHCCRFDSDAVRLLREFMQTRVDVPSHGDASEQRLLRELVIDCENIDDNDLSATLVTMLCMQREQRADHETQWHHTIGSHIRALSLSTINSSCPIVLTGLARKFRRIRLESLSLSNPHPIAALIKCMARISSLRTVKIADLAHGRSPHRRVIRARRLVLGLRENGNITSFSLSVDCQVTAKLAKAYCERNQFLDGLLTITGTEWNRNSDATNVVADSKADTAFCLSLLEVAKQIPHTSANHLFRTMFLLKDSVGDVAGIVSTAPDDGTL